MPSDDEQNNLAKAVSKMDEINKLPDSSENVSSGKVKDVDGKTINLNEQDGQIIWGNPIELPDDLFPESQNR